jgi:hypothetical protein
VTLSNRDRKLLLGIVPLVILLGYWFLVLGPKHQESTKLGAQLTQAEQKRDVLNAQVEKLTHAKKSFEGDYAAVVELGKAIPSSVDMPSLIVQLQRAANGTDIRFNRIHAGERIPAAQPASTGSTGSGSTSSASSPSYSSSSTSSSAPASAAGGKQAGTGAGRAVEKANETKQSQDKQAQDINKGGAPGAANGPTGSTSGAAGGTQTSSVPGLDSVPLEFTFRGSFFDLTNFFHAMKRFVRVANGRTAVHGRLLTIDGFDLKAATFPRLEAQVFATVYLAPKDEGATAGATPGGPAATPQTGGRPASNPSPAPSQPPAATVTAR